MVTRLDDVFSEVIGPQFVDNSEDRFEWFQGNLETESGDNYMTTLPGSDRKEPMVFEYLGDKVTGKIYIAHNPMGMGTNFLAAACFTPLIFVATMVAHVGKLLLTFFQVSYNTFLAVYPSRQEKEFTPLFIDNFKLNLTSQKEEVIETCQEVWNSIKYAFALEAAAISGAIYCNDCNTAAKMQTIFAEIEKKWNHDVDFRESPFSYGIRYGKRFLENRSHSATWESMDISKMQPGFYMLQCYQERDEGFSRVKKVGKSYHSYAAMDNSIRELAQKIANEQREFEAQ